MTRKIRDIMTPLPTGVTPVESVASAARIMRDAGIGTVLVLDNGQVSGIVTDRDIVVRALAEGRDAQTTSVGEVCSGDLITLGPDDDVTAALRLMREHGVRRLPVLDNGIPVGLVSIGDLALWLDEGSVLGDVAAAPPNT